MLCKAHVDAPEVLEHLRLLHPEQDERLETWPDGSPVIIDTTIEPEDFMEQEQEQ